MNIIQANSVVSLAAFCSHSYGLRRSTSLNIGSCRPEGALVITDPEPGLNYPGPGLRLLGSLLSAVLVALGTGWHGNLLLQ